MASASWPAIAAARRRAVQRLPLFIDGEVAGSVAVAHADELKRWPAWTARRGDSVHLVAPASNREHALAEMNAALRACGLVLAWRDETFALPSPTTGAVLATMERAAARFWGTLTVGAHCNGYVAAAGGRPTHLWIARRAANKATDPGKLDNLVGGGVPHGQTPHDTLLREGFEEAGLAPQVMARAIPGSVITLDRDVPEGRQWEQIFSFDLELPAGLQPHNQDGEVAVIELVPVDHAAALAGGEEMTVDAALVTLDFLLRHGLLARPEQRRLAARLAPLIRHPQQ